MKKEELNSNQKLTYAVLISACTPTACTELTYSESDGDPCIQDVVMGALGDCYFMAALASVAWAARARLGNYGNGYKFGTDTTATKLPDKKIATLNGQPCYARVGPRNVIWPLLYERAYAIWRKCGNPCTSMSCISGGAGIKGLEDITGWGKKLVDLSTFDPVSTDPAKKIPHINGIASVPAVAWTSTGDPNNKIYGEHTYSYLGHYPAANPAYVVLRNPYGGLVAEPSTNVTREDRVWYSNPRSLCQINFKTTNDGIFALSLSTFKSKFNGLGYVKQ